MEVIFHTELEIRRGVWGRGIQGAMRWKSHLSALRISPKRWPQLWKTPRLAFVYIFSYIYTSVYLSHLFGLHALVSWRDLVMHNSAAGWDGAVMGRRESMSAFECETLWQWEPPLTAAPHDVSLELFPLLLLLSSVTRPFLCVRALSAPICEAIWFSVLSFVLV